MVPSYVGCQMPGVAPGEVYGAAAQSADWAAVTERVSRAGQHALKGRRHGGRDRRRRATHDPCPTPELDPLGPEAAKAPRLQGFQETRPRGFEPLTFGSVAL